MSIERELLKRVISGDDDGDFFISHRLYKYIETFLAQPEQTEQEPVGIVRTIGGYPDNSEHVVDWLCKYRDLKQGDRLYLAPPKPEQTEQEPVVKITSIHADGENLPVVITGVVLSDAVNIWDLPIKNNNLLFLAPPKREPLSDDEMRAIWKEGIRCEIPFVEIGRAIEKAHGITGVDDEC
jgi:hypothetical protein